MIKVAIYGHQFQPSASHYVQHLFKLLAEKNVEVWILEKFKLFITEHIGIAVTGNTFTSRYDLPSDIRFMLSLGGDGTMLAAVSIIHDSNIPVTGINLGRLGFLASINKDKIEEALTSLLNGDYTIQQRTLLSVEAENDELFNGNSFALNDITMMKRDSSAMITVNVYMNGELLNAYWADGVIVATATGSTAYSLSCGGPIILPGSGNFVITPVSPHNLNVRPLVISDKDILNIEIESRSERFLLSCDSRTADMETTVKLRISKAAFSVNLIRLKDESFLATLRQKLLWGSDARNY